MGDSLPTESHDDLPPLPLGTTLGLVVLMIIATCAVLVSVLMALGFFMECLRLLVEMQASAMQRVSGVLLLIAFLAAIGAYWQRTRTAALLIVGIAVPAILVGGTTQWTDGRPFLLLLIGGGAHVLLALCVFINKLSMRTTPESRIERSFGEEKCPWCQYDIRNLPEPRCPECGMALADLHRQVREVQTNRRGNDQ